MHARMHASDISRMTIGPPAHKAPNRHEHRVIRELQESSPLWAGIGDRGEGGGGEILLFCTRPSHHITRVLATISSSLKGPARDMTLYLPSSAHNMTDRSSDGEVIAVAYAAEPAPAPAMATGVGDCKRYSTSIDVDMIIRIGPAQRRGVWTSRLI